MLGAVLSDLRDKGHTTDVVVPSTLTDQYALAADESVTRADVLLTHLDATKAAVEVAGTLGKPLVAVQHNTFRTHMVAVRRSPAITGLLLTSSWMQREWSKTRSSLPRCTVHPPVDPADYRTDRGGLITQVNLFKNGHMLFTLAAMMPDRKFLAVLGGYGDQGLPTEVPENVEVVDPTDDVVWGIYARTRILLVPSVYESWGRVALEAASSGIPVIASQLPGLQEAMGCAGIYRDPGYPRQWAAAITALDDPHTYSAYSSMGMCRATEVWQETQRQLDGFEEFLLTQVRG